MEYTTFDVAGVVMLSPKVFGDERGFFMETYRHDEFARHCGSHQFVQDNHSASVRGTLRGLHYQLHRPQGKLVRVSKGEVLDVIVDLRRYSATFGQWMSVVLSEQNKRQLWVPPGFAHGFCVISDVAEFQYKCTDYYVPEDEHTLAYNDPDLAIAWPELDCSYILSAKDINAKSFADCAKFQ